LPSPPCSNWSAIRLRRGASRSYFSDFSALALVLGDRNLRRDFLSRSRSAPMKSGFAWRWAHSGRMCCA
jgi:hypothetical protein